jgi:hypothetical protein
MAVLASALEDSLRGDCARRVTQFGQILAARETVSRVVARAQKPRFLRAAWACDAPDSGESGVADFRPIKKKTAVALP